MPRERQPTRVLLSGPLATRVSPTSIQLDLETRSAAPLKSAQLLIGVAGHGEVQFSFVQEPSGDPAMDSEAARQLRAINFAPAEAAVMWGIARVFWGDDAYQVDVRE